MGRGRGRRKGAVAASSRYVSRGLWLVVVVLRWLLVLVLALSRYKHAVRGQGDEGGGAV